MVVLDRQDDSQPGRPWSGSPRSAQRTEIWWNSSPLVYETWRENMLEAATT